MAQLLTVDEVAERLRCNSRKIYDLLHEGAFPSILVGGSRLISEATLDVYLAQLEALPFEPSNAGRAGRQANRRRSA